MNWHVISPTTSTATVDTSIKMNTILCKLSKLDTAPCWQQVLLKPVANCGADGTAYPDKLQNF